MSTFTELIAKVRAQIREISVVDARERLETEPGVEIIDVRERDEFADGHIPGAHFIPRGLLDLRVESVISDKERPVLVYCAGGTRSALAARSLEELGYTDVSSMGGGFSAWKAAGYEFVVPELMSPEQSTRYSRHLLIPEVGEAGQRKLMQSKVLLLGAGGLGSPAALYLAAAGVGTLCLVDDDVVDRSNLQRQVLHSDDRVGMLKVDSAEMTLRALNPDVTVQKRAVRLDADNALELLSGFDIVVDGGDNFATRYLVNDSCVHLGIPVVHGSVYRFEGQVTCFSPQGPCYRCLYPEPPPPELAPSCQEAGVLGVLPGVIGLLQAVEVLKMLAGFGEPLYGRLLAYDAARTEFRELRFGRDPACTCCGEDGVFAGLTGYEQSCNA